MATDTGSNEPISRTDRLALWLADRSIRHPWRVLTAALLLVAAAAAGIPRLDFSNNYRVFFGPDNPELLAFEEFQNTYTKNDNILFVLQVPEGSVFTPEIAAAIERLTEDAWKIPYAIRVDSVTNFQHSWADGDDLTVEDLVRGSPAIPDAILAERERIALAEPLLRGNLLSPDARTTGINVTLQYPEKSLAEVPETVTQARALADRIRTEHPEVRVALSGLSMLNNAFAESGKQDAATLMPLMFLVLVGFTVLTLRSFNATLATLTVIGTATAVALGLAGWIGIVLTPISITAAVIIMTLAIADSVHILVTILHLRREGAAPDAALRESMRTNLQAVVITSVTTIVGFLSLNFSDAPPFKHLGNITAMGIAAALGLSVTLLPALLRLMPLRIPARRDESRLQAALGRLADRVTANHRILLVGIGIATVALMAFVPRIDLNDEFVKYFDYRVPFRAEAEFAIDNLNGVYVVEYSLAAAEAGGISDPDYLATLESFTGWLRSQPEVMHVYSYSDVIRRLNRNMHGDDPAYQRVPEDRDLAAQYLLLYELSLPYGLDLNDRIAIDRSATRVSATLEDLSTSAIRTFVDRSEAWIADHAGPGRTAQATGAAVMFAHISERNIRSMLRGNALALLMIAVIMVLTLRSLSIGLLSLVPNAVPILVTFGIWALTVRQVGMAAATVSATSLGIVVDDTVHILTKYLRARREKGLDAPQAIRHAFRTVGPAVLGTTGILAAGFSVLALSAFRINSQMGLLTALAIAVALPIDFFLLPALLMVGHRTRDKKEAGIMNLRKATATTLVAILMTSAGTAFAASPEEKGFEVAARSDRSDRGFGDSEVELTMVLRNKAGKETTRTLSLRTLEVPDESVGDRSVIVFESPGDIEGTALLSHARILEPDDQWLFLPALKRVKRISSVNKSGPFVGSEFAFEDFTSLELNKYDYTWQREEPCAEATCDVVERRPRYEHSGYTRQLAWIDREVFQVRRVEFYDRRGDLLKTLTLEDYRVYGDGWWRPHRMTMTNHQTGKSTDLIYSDYRFGAGLEDTDFVRGVLERVR